MERLPQINDIVILTYPGRETRSYIIDRIDLQRLLLIDLNDLKMIDSLVLKNNTWRLLNADVAYNVQILPPNQDTVNYVTKYGLLEILR